MDKKKLNISGVSSPSLDCWLLMLAMFSLVIPILSLWYMGQVSGWECFPFNSLAWHDDCRWIFFSLQKISYSHWNMALVLQRKEPFFFSLRELRCLCTHLWSKILFQFHFLSFFFYIRYYLHLYARAHTHTHSHICMYVLIPSKSTTPYVAQWMNLLPLISNKHEEKTVIDFWCSIVLTCSFPFNFY